MHADVITVTKGRITQGTKVIELKKRNDVISHLSVVPRAEDEEEELPTEGENLPEGDESPASETPETPKEN